MNKRSSLRIEPTTPPPGEGQRVPRMVARAIYRKLRTQGFSDAEIAAVADEIVDHCQTAPFEATAAP